MRLKFYISKVIAGISPVLITKIAYRGVFNKRLDLNNPQTFNEKINYLKLKVYPKNPLAVICADKYLVRNYVTDKIGGVI